MNGGAPEEIPEYPRADDASHDGIREEDAALPAWYTWSFIGTVIFAAVYIPFYLFSGWTAQTQYAAEIERADVQYAAVRAAQPKTNPFRGDAAAVAEGKEVFITICAACHKHDGSGLVGPSLVDPYWKFGNSDEALFVSVSEGRPAGMPPWGTQLGTEKIWKSLAYLETLPTSDEPGVGAEDAIGAGTAPGS